MALIFFKTKNFIPTYYYEDFSKIDFNFLKEKGKTIIFLDIDNTIMSYCETVPKNHILENLKEAIKLGFEIVLVSNNNKNRVGAYAEKMNFKYVARAMKPFKRGYKKALKILNYPDKEKIIFVGDQIITDIFGANKMNLHSVLVNPLKIESEHWYTKVNRTMEKAILKKIKKVDQSMYEQILKGKRNEK